MEWHAGNTLAQTVYTCLFVHNLEDIDPEYFAYEFAGPEDIRRPYSLITFVLRAGVLGLLKSCDMAWRELSKCRVLDVRRFNTAHPRPLTMSSSRKTGNPKNARSLCLKGPLGDI